MLYLDLRSGLIFLAVLLFLFDFLRKQSWKTLPPGPPCLPVLGSLPFLAAKDIREPLRKLTTKYGDVITIYLGARRVVVLNTYDAMKEALHIKGEAFLGRPNVFFLKEVTKSLGIISLTGARWKEQRRFTLKALRNFGVGSSRMEDKIQEEMSYFLCRIAQSEGQLLDPRREA
ncbi:hypothetical protein CAPTEDRAFT_208884 [Capitella teleta]|uniref:Uncharacterized protein n=1 Tax=Capitella teleta TaxID=283909 RepID=R7UXN7_CAPTE|nr:hypothetical protein CAPTEDRAFT_208884 [Capitella teleta]|eukprot:ELU08161.1 hypothetical protein CAPTEDRAFT_208884 [Capitella teleta]